jgi:hypothetical protein
MADTKKPRTHKDKPTTLDYGTEPIAQEQLMSATAKKTNGTAPNKKRKPRTTWSREAQVWLLEQMAKQIEPYSPYGLTRRMAEAGITNNHNQPYTEQQVSSKARSFVKQSAGRLTMPYKRVGGFTDINSIIDQAMAN